MLVELISKQMKGKNKTYVKPDDQILINRDW